MTEKNDIMFSLHYTDRGLTCVSGEVELKILSLLKTGNLTLADLSKSIDLPISTLLFNVVKLEEKRVIGSYRNVEDRRKVHYCIISIEFLRSAEPRPDLNEFNKSILNKLISEPDYMYRGMLDYVLLKCSCLGLDIGCSVERCGRMIGNTFKTQIIPGDHNYLERFIQSYFKGINAPEIDIVSEEPLKIRISLGDLYQKGGDPGKTHRSTIGLICSIQNYITGKSHQITSAVTENNGESVLFTLEPMPELKTVSNDLFLPSGAVKIREESDPEKFCIISDKDGYPRLICNELQMDILESLGKSPKSLKMLNLELSGPQSTLFSNLTKLEKSDIIYIDRESPGSNQYKTYGPILLQRNKSNKDHNITTIEIIERAAKDHDYFFNAVLRFVMLVYDSTGIDISKLLCSMEEEIADIMLEHLNSSRADVAIEKVCNDFLPNGSTLKIESYIPLTFSLTNPLFTIVGNHAIMNFYSGLMSRLILKKTGRAYDVTSIEDIINENGTCMVKFSLEPTIR